MRVKADFTVYPRKMPSGLIVYYYQTYDENGKRINGHSTGERTRTMAVKRCNALLKAGKLLPNQRVKKPGFGDYARDFWNPDTSLYLKKQLGRKSLSPVYLERCKRITETIFIPAFGKMQLDQITAEDVETWLVTFTEKNWLVPRRSDGAEVKQKEKRRYKNSYANACFGILNPNSAIFR
jgi:hypothetical protein